MTTGRSARIRTELGDAKAYLTPREKEVYQLRCSGLSYKEIGSITGMAEGTIKQHVANGRRKGFFATKVDKSYHLIDGSKLLNILLECYDRDRVVVQSQPVDLPENKLRYKLKKIRELFVEKGNQEDVLEWAREVASKPYHELQQDRDHPSGVPVTGSPGIDHQQKG